jgi:hypothetical protein
MSMPAHNDAHLVVLTACTANSNSIRQPLRLNC